MAHIGWVGMRGKHGTQVWLACEANVAHSFGLHEKQTQVQFALEANTVDIGLICMRGKYGRHKFGLYVRQKKQTWFGVHGSQ